MTNRPFTPKRWREKGELAPLLQAACELEPPAGARERIWRAIEARHAPLAATEPNPALAALLADAASAVEPPPDAQERIFRQLVEEAEARAGIAEPRRLLDGAGAMARILSESAEMEPPAGRRSRTWLRIAPQRSPARTWAIGGFATAAMAAAVFALWPASPVVESAGTASSPLAFSAPEAVTVQHASSQVPAGAVDVGDTLALNNASDARFSIRGVGEVMLAGAGARLTVAQSDAHGVRLELTGGTVAIHADKRRREAPLVVAAQGVLVKVVGTIFAVSSTDEGVSVATREGLVEVTRGGTVFHVGAGESLAAGELEVHQGLASPWADSYLTTLAGTPLAAAPVVVPAPAAVVAPKPASPRPEPLAASRPAVTKPALTAPATAAEPIVETPAPVASTVAPAHPRVDLKELAKDLLGREVSELRGIASEAARRGDVQRQAAALYATFQASDWMEHREEVANNVVQLALVLDLDLGAPEQALEYWRALAEKVSAKRPAARFQAQLVALELGDRSAARDAVNDCLSECTDEQKDIARWLQALVLRDTPTYPVALRQAATNAPYARHAAALTLSNRARELMQHGHLDRARLAAAFASELDSAALPPDVRGLLRE